MARRASKYRVRVHVYPAEMQKLFDPGAEGSIYRQGQALGAEMVAEAIARAPVGRAYPGPYRGGGVSKGRPREPLGSLKASNGFTVTPQALSVLVTLHNDSDHAVYVVQGTGPVIVGRGTDGMLVPTFGGQPHRRMAVRGQPANDFLSAAMEAATRKYL